LNRELHAEQNMIAFSAREGISLKDCEIIVSLMPCRDCSKLLIALKPKAVYYVEEYDKGESESRKLFEEAGISLTKVDTEN
jgi:dCMP deaminase